MKALTDNDLDKRFADFLDDVHEEVKVCGYSYPVSRLLKAVDPIAYHQEYLAWLDYEVSERIILEVDGKYFDRR